MTTRVLLASVLALATGVPAPLRAQVPEAAPAPESETAPAPAAVSPALEAQRAADERAAEARLASTRLQEAYDAGKDVGIGVPLIAYGSVYTFFGLLTLLANSGGGDAGTDLGTVAGLLITGLGAAQLVPGCVLVHGGLKNRARSEIPEGPAAYDAGYDHGVGRTLSIYGGLILFSAVNTLAQDPDSNPAGFLAVGGAQVAYGAYAWVSGVRAFERLREAPSPPQASRLPPAPRVATVLRISF
jgi:hypothetical protein